MDKKNYTDLIKAHKLYIKEDRPDFKNLKFK
jgi:hypothetical protein